VQEVQVTLPIGTIVQGRYIIEDLLGKGGFGAVYLVRDQRVRQNLFALKEVIDPNKRERKRFIFEAEVLRRLDHPALPRVYRVFEDETHDRAYMLMDYVEGQNLEVLRQRQPGKRFSVQQVLTIMKPIMDAVGYLHDQRPPIIHRDIKPANIIVTNSGDEAVLVDFGIAKEYDPETTTTAVRHASPGYGAPEQYGVGTNTRTDIYGLGATIYALLTGIVPADAFYRTTQLGSKGTDPLEPLNKLAPSVPPHIAEAVHRAMSINSSDRFPTVADFWQALNAKPTEPETPLPAVAPAILAAAQPPSATKQLDSSTTVVLPQKPVGRKRRLGALLLLILALLIGLASAAGLWYVLSHPKTTGKSSLNGTTSKAPHTPAVTVVHTPTPASKPSPTPSPTVKPTPTPTPTTVSGYPYVGGSYSGRISDNVTNPPTTANMKLSIQQNPGQGKISGYFTVYLPLIGSNPFTGTVTTSKQISFLVQGYNGNLPLYFTGQVNADGSLSGNYCSYVNGQCNNQAGGYGTWVVYPQSSGSGSGSSFTPINAPPTAFTRSQDDE